VFNAADTAEELPKVEDLNEGTLETVVTEISEGKPLNTQENISSRAMFHSMLGNKHGKANDPDENN
jgi:hypothetical protein